MVIARQLDHWKGEIVIRGTSRTCTTKISSGNLAIDRIGCQAFLDCTADFQPQAATKDHEKVGRKVRAARKTALIDGFKQCIAQRRTNLIAEYRARRRALPEQR